MTDSLLHNHAPNMVTTSCPACLGRAVAADGEELWNLDMYIARTIATSVRRFRDIDHGYPANFDGPEPWHEILDEIVDGLQAYVDNDYKILPAEKHDALMKRVRKSFRLLGKWLPGMWD